MLPQSQKCPPKISKWPPGHQQRVRQGLSESFGRLVYGVQMPKLVREPRLGTCTLTTMFRITDQTLLNNRTYFRCMLLYLLLSALPALLIYKYVWRFHRSVPTGSVRGSSRFRTGEEGPFDQHLRRSEGRATFSASAFEIRAPDKIFS